MGTGGQSGGGCEGECQDFGNARFKLSVTSRSMALIGTVLISFYGL